MIQLFRVSKEYGRFRHALVDVTATEWVAWAPLLAGILFLGLYPRIVFGTTNDAVTHLLHVFALGPH